MSEQSVNLAEIVELNDDFTSFLHFFETADYTSLFVLCDQHTKELCYPRLKKVLDRHKLTHHCFEVAAGEENKNIGSAQQIWTALSNAHIDRKGLILCLGGGMITDLGAFVAATYKRGIDFVHFPTSLLAMVDAAIGGKCGIDLLSYKNQVGLFEQAKKIFVYPAFLDSLPESELKSGMAEVYKHALIADRKFWEKLTLEESFERKEMIFHSASLKSTIVSRDPFEKGPRKLLNFGHSIGHAIESHFLSRSKPIPHGYAIAAGMIIESYLSEKVSSLPTDQRKLITVELQNIFPKLDWKKEEQKSMLDFVLQDKKNMNGKLQFVLLSEIGKAIYDQEVSIDLVNEALDFYRNGI